MSRRAKTVIKCVGISVHAKRDREVGHVDKQGGHPWEIRFRTHHKRVNTVMMMTVTMTTTMTMKATMTMVMMITHVWVKS